MALANVFYPDFGKEINRSAGCYGTKYRQQTFAEAEYSALLKQKFINHLTGSRSSSEETIKNAIGTIDIFLKYIGIPFWECETSDLDEFLTYKIYEDDISTGRQSSYITYIRKYQDMIIAYHGIRIEIKNKFDINFKPFIQKANCYAVTKKNKTTLKPIQILSENEINKIINQFDIEIDFARSDRSKKYQSLCRDKTIFMLFLLTGLRISEMCSLKLGSFIGNKKHPNFGNYALLRVIGKGSKERVVTLFNPNVKLILDWYIYEIRPKYITVKTTILDCLFYSERKNQISVDSIERGIKSIANAAFITRDFSAHTLRHTYATEMKDVIGAEGLQKQLGHSHLTTTLSRYYHPDSEYIGTEISRGIEKVIECIGYAKNKK